MRGKLHISLAPLVPACKQNCEQPCVKQYYEQPCAKLELNLYMELILRLARGGLYPQLLIKSPQSVNLGSSALSLGLV